MTPEKQTLVGYRLERARQTLEEAKLMFEAGHANACVNRLYYACFYAVSALLLTRNISTSKHSYVRALLHQDYVKPGRISEQMGKHYDLLFSSRQRGDYEDLVVFHAQEVKPWFKPTRAFVEYVADLVARETRE